MSVCLSVCINAELLNVPQFLSIWSATAAYLAENEKCNK